MYLLYLGKKRALVYSIGHNEWFFFSGHVYKLVLWKSNASVAVRLLTTWNSVLLEKATDIYLFHTTCIVLIVSTRVRH